MPTLRTATDQDVDWLLPLAGRLFCEAFEAYYRADHFWGYVDRAFTETGWQAELRDPQSTFQVLWLNDTPQGYFKLNWDAIHQPACLPSANVLEVARFYLDASQHGSGLAQRMIEYAFSLAQQQQRDGLWLGVWEHNHRAMAFYRKYQFQIIGTHPFEMGAGLVEDDFVMFREL